MIFVILKKRWKTVVFCLFADCKKKKMMIELQLNNKQEVKSSLTTLCYIEQDGKYLMLHRIKKEIDVFSMKLVYEGDILKECLVDGKLLER